LTASTTRALDLFAGAEVAQGSRAPGGLQAVADFMEANVPEPERARAGEVLIRILNGVLFELLQLTRERAGLPALVPDEKTQGFMTQAVLALSDAYFYPAPMALQLVDFKQVQASVFQVARAPGKTIVYLGCALLILGVFAMLYVRERRLWVWLTPQGPGSRATLALSSNRQTLDGDREFEQLRDKLVGAKD
jgi:cytochrome c biogenesis protein